MAKKINLHPHDRLLHSSVRRKVSALSIRRRFELAQHMRMVAASVEASAEAMAGFRIAVVQPLN